MGARLVKFDFSPEVNEQIEAVVKVPEEKRSVIHGVVKNWMGDIVRDAVVKLFEVTGNPRNYSLTPITHTFTDEHGEFLFGPLCPKKKYIIKVWYNDVNIREVEICPDYPIGRCLAGAEGTKECDDAPRSRERRNDDEE